VAGAAAAEIAPFLAWLGGRRPGLMATARLGGVVFFTFHHVPLSFDVRLPGSPSGTVELAVALMTGTLLIASLLFRVGRSIGVGAGGAAWRRGFHGATVAIPYGILCWAVSYGVTFAALDSRGQLGAFSVHPSHVHALLWPLGIALVAGFAGGFTSAAEAESDSAWERRLRAAFAGGLRMLLVGLGLSFVGLLVLAAANPHVAGAYFEGVLRPGTARGLSLMWLHAMVIPNMSAWVLYPAMGGCLGASLSGAGSICALSYSRIPGTAFGGSGAAAFAPPTVFQSPPAVYVAFLIVPVAAVLIGGAVAARRSQASQAWGGAAAGALAGVVFAALWSVTLVLSDIWFRGSADLGSSIGFDGSFSARLGPDVGRGTLLALGWGAVGGALGGALWAGLAQRRTPPASTASSTHFIHAP
jgi:hypothetical protein